MILNQIEMLVVALLILALVLAFYRLVKGPSTGDRIISADLFSIAVTSGIVLVAAWLGNVLFLDVALVYGVLAFVGLVALARTIEGEE